MDFSLITQFFRPFHTLKLHILSGTLLSDEYSNSRFDIRIESNRRISDRGSNRLIFDRSNHRISNQWIKILDSKIVQARWGLLVDDSYSGGC